MSLSLKTFCFAPKTFSFDITSVGRGMKHVVFARENLSLGVQTQKDTCIMAIHKTRIVKRIVRMVYE
jgi:hypothetical protein